MIYWIKIILLALIQSTLFFFGLECDDLLFVSW